MRCRVCTKPALSCVERTTRSSVWQPTQLSSVLFCECVPGTLAIHSAFESWAARLDTLTRCRSRDRKSTRLNSSHSQISYAVFCLKKKKKYNFFDVSSETRLGTITTIR